MKRIVIVGVSCAGKTTLAHSLAQRIGLPHIELDAMFWLPNWVPREDREFRGVVESRVAADRWVVDGNYSRVRDLVWSRATAVVWLNYSLPIVLWRGLRRTTRRAILRERLYNGNRETLRHSFLSRDSILLWILRSHRRREIEYRELLLCDSYTHLRWFEVRHPHQLPQQVRRIEELAQGREPDPHGEPRGVSPRGPH